MNTKVSQQVDLSVVVPLYNEEDSIQPLFSAIMGAVDQIDCDSEVIFVDDGSADSTFAAAESLAQGDSRLRVVKFRRNYGQTPAMAAGIDIARGTVIVTMDGDLQNDPDDISLFLDKIDEGFDIVVGWRFDRQDKLVSRKIPSRIANWIIGKVTGVEIKDNGCSLKAFRADIIKNVPLYSEMHRFIPAMASMAGPKIAEIKVRHHARQFGESKYGLSRVYKVLLDLLTIKTISGFASTPLLWFGMLALPFFFLSLVMVFGGITTILVGGTFSIPILGSGLFFLSLAIFFLLSGGLAELVVRTGDAAAAQLPLITATEMRPNDERHAAIDKRGAAS
ncbi:MAG: glycosyltransferase family 2 protein [Pseudomonadota bacterium]